MNEIPGTGMPLDLSDLIGELDRMATSVSPRKGAVLFHSGDPVSGVFVIRKGNLRMSLGVPSQHYLPRILGPGDLAGLPATLTGQYSLTAQVASEEAELGFVPSPRVSNLLASSPRLCFLAMRFISEEISRVRNALKEMPPIASPIGREDE